MIQRLKSTTYPVFLVEIFLKFPDLKVKCLESDLVQKGITIFTSIFFVPFFQI